jgi:succinate dehydrogenase/fumarate reductase flavoprotein subunit
MALNTEIVDVDTDVLVIGGGLAGCMAAIKARESNLSVTIAEKANTLASGCAGSGIDHMWAYIPEVHEPMGYTMDDMADNHVRVVARGFVNRDILRLVIEDSYQRMLDLEKFGLKFRFEDSKQPGKFRVVHQFHALPDTFNFEGRRVKVYLTKEAKRRGAKIYNRVNMTELLTTADGHVAGALGYGTRDGRIYRFRAKAVVTSTGRVNRLNKTWTDVWGNHRIPVSETGDGRAMAYRAGAKIINMEFLSPARFSIGNFELNLGSPRNTVQPAGSVVDGNGRVIVPRTQFYPWETLDKGKVDVPAAIAKHMESTAKTHLNYHKLMMEGQGPFYLDLTGGTEEEINYIEWSISHEGKGSLFLEHLHNQVGFDFRKDKLEWLPNSREMAGTASSGLLVDKNLESNIKGLYAAGDEVGGVPWSASPGAFTMGWKAGENAAKEAASMKALPEAAPETLERLDQFVHEAKSARGGQHWREVELAVQNIVDHYAGNHRAEKMLERGLTRLAELRELIRFHAANPHETGHCLEVNSLLDNAEMVLRGSRERKESRLAPFGFMRADYPEPNDAEFFNFLAQQKNGKGANFSKVALPR